jgi:lycopene beta-cyclase
MTAAPDVDVAIVGGGLAGTLAALALARAEPAGLRRIAVIDRSPTPLAGRHWAYFSPVAIEPDAEVAAWQRVRVRSAAADDLLQLQHYRYRRLAGDRLAAGFDAAVARAGGRVTRITDPVTGLFPGTDDVRVRLASGSLRASWVLDSAIGLPVLPGGPWLSFLGVRIAVPAAAPDPVLMDFTLPQSDGVRFGYVLPEGPDALFVEATSFRTHGPDTGLDEVLQQWLRTAWPDHRRIGPVVERAALPLHRRTKQRAHGRILHIGRAGGRTRRSTGYGVLHYQQDADAVAGTFARNGRPGPLPPVSRRQRWLDDVAMRVLAHDPAALRAGYAQLFQRNTGDDVLAFLAGAASARQAAAIVASLPLGPFLRAALAG